MTETTPSRIYKTTAYLLFSVLLTIVIVEARLFLYPIALGVLFSYLLYPVASFFEKKLKMPRILSNLITIITAITFFVFLIFIVVHQLKILMNDMPGIKRKIFANIEALFNFIESRTGISNHKQKLFVSDSLTKILEGSRPFMAKAFTATTGTIVRIGLMPVFVFFMLYYRDKAYNFLMKVSKRENRWTVRNVIFQISHVTKRYMGGVFVVVMILTILNPLGLYIIGLDYFIFFGIISAFCNFIPYFGTILGFSFPLGYALVTGDSPSTAFGVVGLFIVIQFTENNILTPNIVGDNVKLNPFVIILSLIIGAMVWGIPGMLVIVPTMAVFRIIFENMEKFKPYAYLLGTEGTEKHAVTLKKIKSLFARKKKQKPKQDNNKNNELNYSI